MNWLTVVFIGGQTLTRKPDELFAMRKEGAVLNVGSLPSDPQVILNWDNVCYVREAYQYEVRGERERRGN